MFIPDPGFQGDITPFQFGIMREYMPEYNLELCRERSFRNYPSRLSAIYLFMSKQVSDEYKACHDVHVRGRVLKKCHSVAIPCVYSVHDSSLVDFLDLLIR